VSDWCLPADQAALAIFTEGILGQAPEPINMDLEARSVPGFFAALDGVFRGVHFISDADALVVLVDCDNTEPHHSAHDEPGKVVENCRLCKIRKTISKARSQVKARQGSPALRIAVGLAVPAIEAWYLVGKNHQVGEAAWRTGLTSGKPPFATVNLKVEVYGTERPSLEHETDCAVREARRVIADLSAIETAFPDGFGAMAREMRSWMKG